MKSSKNIEYKFQIESCESLALLARAFSPTVISEFAKTGKSQLFLNLMEESGIGTDLDMSLRSLFDALYRSIESSYRNEYVYKNIIAQKILLGRHSLNSSSMLTELRVADSIADIVIVNGTSHLYEIKTELDSLERLKKQLDDYTKFADKVNIVTSEIHAKKLLESTDARIGILILSDQNTLRVLRKPLSNKINVSPSVIFGTLRQKEYKSIIQKETGQLPDVPNTRIYSECSAIFEKLDNQSCHDHMVTTLKKRKMSKNTHNFIMQVPYSLKAAAISSNLTSSQIDNFINVLNQNVGRCLN